MHITKLLKRDEDGYPPQSLSTSQSPSSSRQETTLALPCLRKSQEGEYSFAWGSTLASQEVLSEEAAVTTLERRANLFRHHAASRSRPNTSQLSARSERRNEKAAPSFQPGLGNKECWDSGRVRS